MWINKKKLGNFEGISTSGKFEKKLNSRTKQNDGWRIRPCGNARSPIVSPFSLGSLSPNYFFFIYLFIFFLVTNSRSIIISARPSSYGL